MDIKQQIEKRCVYIEKVIQSFLPAEKEAGFLKTIIEAMNYSMLAGGKRLRPMLMLESFCLFNGSDIKVVEPFMAAIEMIHTYSLIHDDLPAMDNDDYRRGRKTTHVVYGEAMGILSGDALLNYAFETAVKSFQFKTHLSETTKAMEILASKPGIYGMIGGQAVDVENENTPMDKEKLDYIYHLKTGALLEASMMIGAVLAGVDHKTLKIVENIAGKIGLSFQIQDDILDVTSAPEVLGKPVYSDEKNHKTTYVTLFGVEKAKETVEKISAEALDSLKSLPYQNEFLYELIVTLINREK